MFLGFNVPNSIHIDIACGIDYSTDPALLSHKQLPCPESKDFCWANIALARDSATISRMEEKVLIKPHLQLSLNREIGPDTRVNPGGFLLVPTKSGCTLGESTNEMSYLP